MGYLLKGAAEKEKEEFDALLERVKPLDKELYFLIDEAFGAVLAEMTPLAFKAGFDAARDPSVFFLQRDGNLDKLRVAEILFT